MDGVRLLAAFAVSAGVVGLRSVSPEAQPVAPATGADRPANQGGRRLTKEAMTELRKKTEGATNPGADLREYVVGVELLPARESRPRPRQGFRTGHRG